MKKTTWTCTFCQETFPTRDALDAHAGTEAHAERRRVWREEQDRVRAAATYLHPK